jgi:hypothetical protein
MNGSHVLRPTRPRLIAVVLVATLVVPASVWGQVAQLRAEPLPAAPIEEEFFVPPEPPSTAPEPLQSASRLIGKKVQVHIRGTARPIEGRLNSANSQELIVAAWGNRKRIPLAEVIRIEPAATQTSRASVSVFVGVASPAPRMVVGVAPAWCERRLCMEGEVARTWQDAGAAAPSLTTVGLAFLIPFKSPAERLKFHVAFGASLYDETGDYADTGGGISKNVGAGFNLAMASRLKFRFDYRSQFLDEPDGGTLFASPVHRATIGFSVPW